MGNWRGSLVSARAPVLFYLIGMSSMFLSDLLIAKGAEEQAVANWALLKSIVFLSGPIILLGVEQILVREPEAVASVYGAVVVQCILASSIVSVFWNYLFDVNALQILMAVLCFSILSLNFAICRAQLKFGRAQLVLNGWKLFLFLIILVDLTVNKVSIEIAESFVFVLVLSALLVIAFRRKVIGSFRIVESFNLQRVWRMVSLGKFFAVSTIVLNLSLYLEQALLNFDGKQIESAELFRHSSAILPFIIALNGFAYFYIGPIIKRNPRKMLASWRRYRFIVFFAIGLMSWMSYLIGATVFEHVYHDSVGFNGLLALLICLIAFLRTAFLFPCAVVSVLGSKGHVRSFVVANILGLLVFLFVYYAYSRWFENFLLAVGFGSLANWIVRTIFAFRLKVSIEKESYA